jgi:hypothetical protein
MSNLTHPPVSSQKLRRIYLGILFLLISVVGATCSGTAIYKYNTTSNPVWECQHASKAVNPVAAENLCPGTKNWQVDRPTGPTNAIEGFTAPVSVNVGGSVKIYVSTTAPTYKFQVYRLGWYQGLGGRLVYSSSTLGGIAQPQPVTDPVTRMVSCSNWHNPATLVIPTTWVSGIYVIKLLSSLGYMRYTSFVLRNDTSHSSILFQTSVLTYEAYNIWGGYSLYRGSDVQGEVTSQDRAYVVSFDRPYVRGDGLGDFPLFNEFNLLRWFERSGYDISYTTDIDTDMRGALLLQHQLFVSAGHDEYWSTAMRDHVTIARDTGVSLAFFGGNDVYWHVRLQSSPLGPDRQLICYKPGYYEDNVVDPVASFDPGEDTVLWRDPPLNEPENALLGEMYGGAERSPAPLVLADGAGPFLSNTTLHAGSAIPGLINIGGEYDRIYHNGATPSSLVVLASSPLQCIKTSLCPSTGTDSAYATLYTIPHGAKVFDAGTFYWGWGLDDTSFDPRFQAPPHPYSSTAFQRLTANLIAYLLNS